MMKVNYKRYRWIAEITLVLMLVFVMRFWFQRNVVEGIAPNISVATLSGQHFDLYKEKNRPILIHYWASWCPVCKLEQSNIDNIAKDFPVMTIAMSSGSNNELKQFMKKEKLSFNVINDEAGDISRTYNIQGVPVSFIVNKNNLIEFVEVGYTTELGLRMRLWWAGI